MVFHLAKKLSFISYLIGMKKSANVARLPLLVTAFLAAQPTLAQDNFAELQSQAKGQVVYFNAWGGDDKINAYISWAGDQLNDRYGITLEHVKLTDTAAAISRILAEKTAGRDDDGSVDLLWVNGENFAAMKRADLLQDSDWVTSLPSWAYTDEAELPAIALDFAVPTDGLEAPWGRAQLVFFYDKTYLTTPPDSAEALAQYIANNPGRFTYPQPPDFIGVSFLKQILTELTEQNEALYQPVSEADFDAVTAPLWDYLARITPDLWRGGKAYPQNYPAMRQLLADGELDIYIAFNPADASSAIAQGQLPDSVRSYIHQDGTIANVHFLAIPFNSGSVAAAKLTADFMMSPEAQIRKADPAIWGDPSVLSQAKLAAKDKAAFAALPKGIATLSPAELAKTLPEPHPSWVPALEAEWKRRFASGQ
ncbi:MAG: ABC transporter substrate-binding protein [Candidatus Puniceispirillaceae bacterium]